MAVYMSEHISYEDGACIPGDLYRYFLPTIFLEIAHTRPQAAAVIAAGEKLFYGTLAARVRAWAGRLVNEGLTVGQPVGLCVGPVGELAVGFLAILAAGGVVTPLDPALPAERLGSLARAIDCHVVLGHPATRALIGEGPVFHDLTQTPAAYDQALPELDPTAIACLYHTSGSTGRPKPVALSHRALAARIRSMAAWFDITDDETICGASSLAFDPFLQQFFFALTGGGTLWLPERDCLLDPPRFWREAAQHGVSHLNLVPSQVTALLERPPAAPLPRLKRVVMGGERMAIDLPRRITEALGPVAVYNMYGPTEALVDASGWRIALTASDDEVAIGRPLPGCRIRILDKRLNRVADGAEGELCIGGAGLAEGYLGMPEATAERFVADPFGAPGDRLYRTGDVARWRPDGMLSFVGRVDEQVKLRGQRIELGEIESTLAQHPQVRAAAVRLWPDAPGGPAVLAWAAASATPEALRDWLAARLPAAAVPLRIMILPALPAQPSGKIDRQALPLPVSPAPSSLPLSGTAIEQAIARIWAELLGQETVDPQANLFEMGAHSLLIPKALVRIADATGATLSPVDLFRFPTITALARRITGAASPAPIRAAAGAGAGREIAVIGMSFRYPGASDRDTLWRNLLEGAVATRRFSPAELASSGVSPALLNHPDFIPVGAPLEGTALFDPLPFGYGRGEAAEIDPQQRLLLETAWHALEDAACDPRVDGPVGAFVGTGFNAYLLDNLRERIGYAGGADRYSIVVGGDKDFAATRLAYKLGLTGPATTIGCACSTGLAAIAAAVDSLRLGRCRVALTGAASLGMFSPVGYVHAEGGIASRSGICRPFDAAADGTIGGAGACILVLKRLDDAIADGDTIHAVIRGVGVANDGADKAAFAAPSVDGQAAAIAAALADAGVEGAEIGYVEGHGTATALGDPIEVTALNLAFAGTAPQSILLGSIKGNLGHLDAASGTAGFVKTVLTLAHGVVPPTAGYGTPNPRIPFAEGPFRVSGSAEPWPGASGRPRLAGVSSFGMGGTNVHMILEAPPTRPPAPHPNRPALLMLSAATATARDALSTALAAHLDESTDAVEAVAASLGQRRRLGFRRAVVATDGKTAAASLRSGLVSDGQASPLTPSLAFLFPGQGAQRPGMARDLYQAVPVARAVLDEAHAVLAGTGAAGLRDLLLADPTDSTAALALNETELTQPALFVVEWALTQALLACGLRPTACCGHSVGEYVGACLAGCMEFPDALRLVAARGRLMAQAPRGAMFALSLPEADTLALMAEAGEGLWLATVNGPRQCVVGGTEDAISRLARVAEALGRPGRRLPVSHAFHSGMMDPILDAFAGEVARTPLRPPTLPVLSNLTGRPLSAEEAMDAGYWVRHLRGTVRFIDGLKGLTDEGLLLEVGPGVTLSRLARATGFAETRAIATQPETSDGVTGLFQALGRLWAAGVDLTPSVLFEDGGKRRIPLPTYPFERVRLWLGGEDNNMAAPATPALIRAKPIAAAGAEAIVAEIWRDVLGLAEVAPDADFLALGGDSLIAVRIAGRLRERLACDVSAEAVLGEGTIAGLTKRLTGLQGPAAGERETGWL